jgi:hypothetical protein
MSERRTKHLAVLVTEQFRSALELAAERRFTTPSEYTRQAIIERMRADQIEPVRAAEQRVA